MQFVCKMVQSFLQQMFFLLKTDPLQISKKKPKDYGAILQNLLLREESREQKNKMNEMIFLTNDLQTSLPLSLVRISSLSLATQYIDWKGEKTKEG